jgi:phage portal protein BeeE
MLVQKAIALVQRVAKASRGSLSSYVLNAPHQYGQPLPQMADAQALITPQRMREVVMKTPTCGAAINAILDFSTGVKLGVRNVDPTQRVVPLQAKRVKKLLRNPNPQDSERQFKYKLLRDMATLGYAAIEIERNPAGGVANLWPLDAAKVAVDYDEHGTVLGYDMLDAHGFPIAGADKTHAWLPENVIWLQRSPQSNSLYPSSQISQLFTAAVLEDYMLFFISGRFNDSNVPYGVYDLGDVSTQELNKAVENWNNQVNAQHRVMLTGSKSGGKWTPFGYHLKDLEAPSLLSLVRSSIMGVLGVTENELGQSENVNKSSGFSLSYTFKRRAIEPLLYELCETLTTRLLWENLGLEDVELYYEEIDSRDELLQAQIDDLYHKMGVWSTNFIRNQKGQPNTAGGDEPALFTGSAWLPVSMVKDMAKAQLKAIQDIDKQMESGGGPPGSVTPPALANPKLDNDVTNEAATKEPKIKLPKPQPRGPVQAAQSAGSRKDQQ